MGYALRTFRHDGLVHGHGHGLDHRRDHHELRILRDLNQPCCSIRALAATEFFADWS